MWSSCILKSEQRELRSFSIYAFCYSGGGVSRILDGGLNLSVIHLGVVVNAVFQSLERRYERIIIETPASSLKNASA